jgi:hypothetical protein
MDGSRRLKRYCATGILVTKAVRAVALGLCLAQIALAQDGLSVAASLGDGQTNADWVDSTKQWIESTTRATGSPPTDRQLAERAAAARASFKEFPACWKALLKAHQAIVTKQDLIEVIRAKRESIHDVRCKYTFQQERLDDTGALALVFRARNLFCRSGVRLRLHSTYWRGSSSESSVSEHCYNGSFVQFVDWSLHTPNASIDRLRGYSDYYRTYDVLANAMLLDCDVDLGVVGLRPFDLLELLNAEETILLQELEEVDGRKCLVLTDSAFRAYLDVERDFSVTGLDVERLVFDEMGRAIVYRLDDTRRFEAITDHGSGIWLPHRMETTFLKNGVIVIRETTDVSELAVNEGVDDSVFENIIPQGAFVFDSIRGASYNYGEEASIEGTLGAAVGARTTRIRWVLVIVNVVAICVIGGLLWHRRARHVG